ncbi:hypothetical protein BGZ58_010477 [Dissophora ornata]|nr:hypothetical protein BGZ58_010477 [Dissophora ornata]
MANPSTSTLLATANLVLGITLPSRKSHSPETPTSADPPLLGQACVFGACADIPANANDKILQEGSRMDQDIPIHDQDKDTIAGRTTATASTPPTLTGLSKGQEVRTFNGLASHLPPLRGPSSNVFNYVAELSSVEKRLSDFYNGKNHQFHRNKWDEKRVPTVRSLGYIVVGINEFYTSKKCLCRHKFVAQVEIRRFYCPVCKAYMHRDVMAAENMSNIVRGHLVYQQRPLYLQPRAAGGTYPWMSSESGPTDSTSTSNAASTADTTTSARTSSILGTAGSPRKRTTSTSTPLEGTLVKKRG